MNLTHAFLSLFSAYRSLIDKSVRDGDTILSLRSSLDRVESDLAAERQSSINRERDLSNELLRAQLHLNIPVRRDTLSKPQSQSQSESASAPSAPSVLEWRKQGYSKFHADLAERRKLLLNRMQGQPSAPPSPLSPPAAPVLESELKHAG